MRNSPQLDPTRAFDQLCRELESIARRMGDLEIGREKLDELGREAIERYVDQLEDGDELRTALKAFMGSFLDVNLDVIIARAGRPPVRQPVAH